MAASTARQLLSKWGLLVTQWLPSSGKQVSRCWESTPCRRGCLRVPVLQL